MESKIEIARHELGEIVERITDSNSRDFLRMYLLGDLPLRTIALIKGTNYEDIRTAMKKGLKSIGIEKSATKLKEEILKKHLQNP